MLEKYLTATAPLNVFGNGRLGDVVDCLSGREFIACYLTEREEGGSVGASLFRGAGSSALMAWLVVSGKENVKLFGVYQE